MSDNLTYRKTLTSDQIKDARVKYRYQKYTAIQRGISFELTFDEWIEWWLSTGHYHERGHGAGKYVMSRYGDQGPYSLTNIFCQTLSANSAESARRSKGIPKSAEHKRKISDAHKGKPKSYDTWNKGKTKENCDTIHQAAERAKAKGRKCSTETKAKIGKANSKRIMTPAGEFESRHVAAEHYGITPEGVGARTRYYPDQYYYL